MSDLRSVDLAQTLIKQTENLTLVGIQWTLVGDSLASNWSLEQQKVMSEIIQESVTNIIRHSHATTVAINFSETPVWLALAITDNGNKVVNNAGQTHGISGMHERITAMGGQFKIKSNTKITVIKVTIPRG